MSLSERMIAGPPRRCPSRTDERSEVASGVVTNSPAMRALVELASRIAALDAAVLVVGESGAGKQRISRLVHHHSPRASDGFIALRCGALPETLLETELFGHARGAVAGATHDRAGLLESASGGTLVLEGVGDASTAVQLKLLHALQERQVRRIGESNSRAVDVRVVATTNRSLADAVEAGTFRRDLHDRLTVAELHVPPLRDRPEDMLPLAHMLLADAAARMQRRTSSFGAEVAEMLLSYAWPGNVRELGNAMERAAAVAQRDELVVADLPEEIRNPALASVLQTGAAPPLERKRVSPRRA